MFQKNKKEEKRKQGLRTRTFLYFLLFTIIFIAFLWVFQTIYLGRFYQRVKISEAKNVLRRVSAIVTDEDARLMDVDHLSKEYDMQILVTDENGVVFYSSSPNFSLFQEIREIPPYYERARKSENGFTVTTKGDYRNLAFPRLTEDSVLEEQNLNADSRISLISCKVVRIGSREYLLLLTSLITPIESTVSTLRLVLFMVSIGMILVSVIMSTVLSKSLSKPIEKMNEEAKMLIHPEKAEFNESSVKEISELSKTLNYAATELAKTEKLQKDLIANVSHDLRTPLTMVKGYAEVMRDIPGENTPENVQVIIDETERLSMLVSDLLDASKLSAGVIHLNVSTFDLTKHIEDVISRFHKFLLQEDFQIDFMKIGPVMTKADPDKIDQVLYNLMNNAINYSGDEKRIEVKEELFIDHVRISIKNDGPVISEEDLNHLFDRYYRSRDVKKKTKVGSGLGLSIVKSVLELHETTYGVESSEETGTVFYFELPYVKSSD